MGHYLSEMGGLYDGPSAEYREAEGYRRTFFEEQRKQAEIYSGSLVDSTLTPTSWLIYATGLQCNEDCKRSDPVRFPHNRQYVEDTTGISIDTQEYVDGRVYSESEGTISFSATLGGTDLDNTLIVDEHMTTTRPLQKLPSVLPIMHIDASRFTGDSDVSFTWEEAKGYDNPLFKTTGKLIIAGEMAITHMTRFNANRPEEVITSLVVSQRGKFIVSNYRHPMRYRVIQIS